MYRGDLLKRLFSLWKICRFVIRIEASDFQTKQFSNKFACNIRQSSERRINAQICRAIANQKDVNAYCLLLRASIRNEDFFAHQGAYVPHHNNIV